MQQFSPELVTSLNQILARDIMTKEVLTVYEGWSIKRLADFFVRHRISGAPVIASDHTLVGVVTVSDIVRFDSLDRETKAKMVSQQVYAEYLGQEFAPDDLDQLAQNAIQNCTVNSIMTKSVVQLDAETPLPQVAKVMEERQIRRVFITSSYVIVGVVSTNNLLRQLASMV